MEDEENVCPVCGRAQAALEYVFDSRREGWLDVHCPVCREYTITYEARKFLPHWENADPLIRRRVQRYVYERQGSPKVLIANHPAEENGYDVLALDEVRSMYTEPSDPLDTYNRTVVALAQRTRVFGQEFTSEKDRWVVPTMDDDEACDVIDALIQEGCAVGGTGTECFWQVSLTRKGLEHAARLSRTSPPAEVQPVATEGSGIPRVFLSHSHVDNAFAERLANDLHDRGIDVWFDGWDLDIGHDLTVKIQEGIRDSDFLAVILSPEAVASAWVETEWTTAFQRGLKQRKVVVLPILYKDCEMPLFLQGKKHADFRNPDDYGERLTDLIRRIRGGSKRPSKTAPAPPAGPKYEHTIRASFQGQNQIRKGNCLRIDKWFGPEGAGGNGQLRIELAADLTDDTAYRSDLAGVTMTIVPVDVTVTGRVAGKMERSGNTTSFDFELTDIEYQKFYPNREAKKMW